MKLPFSPERLPVIIGVALALGGAVTVTFLVVIGAVLWNGSIPIKGDDTQQTFHETPDVLAWQQDANGSVSDAATESATSTEVDPFDYASMSGEEIYTSVCSLCHGADGTSNPLNPMIRVPTINNPDALAAASDDFLYHIIAKGRSGTAMAPMEEVLTPAGVQKVVDYIRAWEAKGADPSKASAGLGKALAGREHYRNNCASCHGMIGEGGIGVVLNTPNVLGQVTDHTLADSIINGRAGTAMASWKHLSTQTVNDLLAYLRSWQGDIPVPEADTPKRVVDAKHTQKDAKGNIIYHEISDRSLHVGKAQYERNCLECHGAEGKFPMGDMTHIAPTLNNKEFLEAASDGYLLATIARGREHTPMRAFGVDTPAGKKLGAQSMKDIVAYIRSWEQSE